METAKVKVIPATRGRFAPIENAKPTIRRVAGYARVSTESEEQLTSYEAQVDYYTRYIQSRSDWQFVEMYTDVDAPYGQNANRP